jgi:hypothetical protein
MVPNLAKVTKYLMKVLLLEVIRILVQLVMVLSESLNMVMVYQHNWILTLWSVLLVLLLLKVV